MQMERSNMTSECKLVERLSDEVASFCKSRRTSSATSKSGNFEDDSQNGTRSSNLILGRSSSDCNSKSRHRPHSKDRSLLGISSYIYFPFLLLVASVQYFGGVNEIIVELMSFTYHNYGFLHGGEHVYVDTNYGRLKGFTSVSREGREFYQFLGIPYSKPPVGELRFQPPVPPESWDDVKDATGYGKVCFQYDLFLQAVMGSEDCLTLNVYTPKSNASDGQLLPVLFFIHGGMYMFGRAIDFRGDHFMDEDVVVVTINYRLNIFGFLNTGDGLVRGNMGLKDQVLALRYVRENIEHFGGNPNLITIWGESAGGASVQLHQLSPLSQGLFHRAIASSGFSLAHWSFTRQPREQANIFAKKVECPTTSTDEMISCLKSLPGRKIAEVLRGTHDVLHPRLDVFAPTIESGFPHENDTDTFLAEHPRQILSRGDIRTPVPMISGVNAEEGLIYAGYFIRNETVSDQLNQDWLQHGPVLIDYEDLPEWERDDVSKRIWNYYLGNRTIGMDTLYEVVDLFSDASFNKPLMESAVSYSKKAPLYLYIYNHRGSFGVAQIYFRITLKFPILVDGLITNAINLLKKHLFGIEEKHYGTCHADEQALFFKMHPLLSNIRPGHKEFKFSRELIRIWASFAKTGKPDQFEGHRWDPVTPGQPFKFMQLTDQIQPGMRSPPWTSRLKFLNTLPGFQCMDRDFLNSSSSISDESICF